MILVYLFVVFVFCLIKKFYEQFINKSKTAKVVLLFQIVFALILSYLIGEKWELISVLFILVFLTHVVIVDIEKYLIPYSSLLVLLFIGIIGILLDCLGYDDILFSLGSIKSRLTSFTIFIIIGFILNKIQNLLNKDFLGGGDLMLFCVYSLIIGFEYTILVLFISSFLALLVYPLIRKRQIPFGPFLSISFILIVIFCKKM